ncbi:MAG: TonB-dependent receptor [Pseudomonadota bacterium]
MTKFMARTVLMGCVSAIAVSTHAFAQDDEEPVAIQSAEDNQDNDITDTIVVTSFRRSLQDAIANKRNADAAIESITAEDIGRLPDISIAEALARLPGIASQRITGQASALNVRGLSQQLTFSTLNGREQVSLNGNRSVEFEQFPSELISGADVYKTSKASIIEGGIAGTIDLKTVRPLDRDGRSFTLNARGIFNDRANDVFGANNFGYRVSASYIDQFLDNTLGVSIGYARLVQPDVAVRFVGFDYDGFAPNDFNGDGETDVVTFGFETEEEGGTDTRDGLIGTIQWQPTENFSWEIDAYYSVFESDSFARGIRVIGPQAANFGNPNTLVTNPVVAVNPLGGSALIGGTFMRNVEAPTDPANPGGFGLTFQNINDNQFDEDELFSIGSKLEYDVERFRASFDFTYSRADSFFANEVSNILPIVSLDGGVPGESNSLAATPVIAADQTVTYLLNGTDLPSISFVDDFTDLSVQRLANFGAFPFDNEDELFAFAGDFEYRADWGPFRSFELGVRYSTREAEQFRESSGFGFGNDAGFFQFASMPFDPISLDGASQVECFEGDFADAGFPCFLIVDDPRALFESVNGPVVLDQSAGFTLSDSFLIEEDVISGYALANLDTTLFGLPLTGNIGLRVVQTDQNSANAAAVDSGLSNFGELSFTRLLPAANFVIKLTDNDQIRLGGSRAITRPPLFQLGSGFNVSITNGIPSGGGSGNPGLLPFLSNNGDIAYEHYFENGGLVTVAFFYKSLESFIVSETDTQFDFEAAGLLPALMQDPAFGSLATTVGTFGGPINGEGGNVWGFEFAYTQTFDWLPAPFDGFGLSANYGYTESQIDFTASNSGATLTLPLPGLSDHVVNGTVFYEKGGFSNRVGLRYRTEFISPQVGLSTQLPFTDSELVVDYQASYSFEEESALGGLTLLFQANNLTDEPTITFFGQEAQTGTIQNFGRAFFFGASYSF